MPVNRKDLEELQRIATNSYDEDKAFIYRVIRGIAEIENENTILRRENDDLRKQLLKK